MSEEVHFHEIVSTNDYTKSAFIRYDPTKTKYCNSENTSPVVTCNESKNAKKQKQAKNVYSSAETKKTHY